ncbi:hypothetical protein [Shimia sp. R9_2]|uniref:hypothetical protein n=1 Tax=Shimia sp. R9_2 TaxID=2821112 RepID=UPI001FFDF0FE|nr:hypothetical protein [Shimia sp. R9_2]
MERFNRNRKPKRRTPILETTFCGWHRADHHPWGEKRSRSNPDTKRILGGGVVGQGAGDLIAEIALAIEMGADTEDIALTVHPHPTLSETIGLAAELFEGTITDL